MITEKHYKYIITEDFILKQNFKNIMEIPKLNKIVLNASSKIISNDKKYLIPTLLGLELCTGQKLKITKAKKSIATFKLRQNQIIGCKVTLRNVNLLIFFEKFIKILLPRLNDFRGLPDSSFDQKLTFNIGINHFLIFPELESYFEYFKYVGGVDISIQLSINNLKTAHLFYSAYQLPLFFAK